MMNIILVILLTTCGSLALVWYILRGSIVSGEDCSRYVHIMA